MLRPLPELLAEKRVRRAAMELWRGQRWLALSRDRMLTARFMGNGIDSLAANQAVLDEQTCWMAGAGKSLQKLMGLAGLEILRQLPPSRSHGRISG